MWVKCGINFSRGLKPKLQEGSGPSGVSPSVTFLCFPMKDRPSSQPDTTNGKEAQAESAQRSLEYDSRYIGVSVGTVAGAGLCCEDDCASVTRSGLGANSANDLWSVALSPRGCSVSSSIKAKCLSWHNLPTGS